MHAFTPKSIHLYGDFHRTKIKGGEAPMQVGDSFFKTVIDQMHDGVYFTDRSRRITYWNHGAERITGYVKEEVIGTFCKDHILMHVNDEGVVLCTDLCPLAKTIKDGSTREADVYLHHKDGHRVPVTIRVNPIYDHQGAVIGAVEVFTNSASKIAALEKIKEWQKAAFIDPLTTVGNRRYTEIVLTNVFDDYRNQGLPFGLLFVDIDHYKKVNDTYGHQVGDRVLQMVAQTLTGNVKSYDFVGRWGGDEFLIVMMNVDRGRLLSRAEMLCRLVEQSHLMLEHEMVNCTISIGAALVNQDADWQKVLHRADRFLYQSKKSGRNQVTID
jgi:diguanylate cyclase (GGDEF)-like protein/PAS domain S-box-containing protein